MKKILLVDDEKILCSLVKKNLEFSGEYSVETISDPKFAVEAATRIKPDIILMDVMMPGTSGSTVASLMREKPLLKEIPIIFLTGIISSDEVKKNDNIIGGEYFVSKPVEIDELIAVLHRLCG